MELAAVVSVVGALTIFRLWAAAHAGLAPDETYYWLWSRTPALGYADHPPMIAWWIWLSTRILGDTPLGIRALPVISALVTSVAVYGIATQLWRRSTALRAALWFNAMILIGVGAIFATPDAPSTMFWALAVWALSAIFRTQRSWIWILVGLFAGLGCVSKYTNLFLGLGIVVWLSIDPAGRRWFRSPWLWAGGVVACFVFLPVFLWNAQHDWISFSHQFGRINVQHVRLPYYLGEFLASQLGLLNPLIAYFAFLALGLAFKKPNEYRLSPSAFLALIAAPIVGYMVLHALHDRVQANWLAPIYPQVALLAAAAAGDELAISPMRERLIHLVVPLGCTISAMALVYLAEPFDVPLPFPSPTDRLEGWQDLAATIERLRPQSGAAWIATTSYDVNAELAYYMRGRVPVRQITERERYTSAPIDSGLVPQPALLVRLEKGRGTDRFERCFEVTKPLFVVARQGAGGIIERYRVESALTAQPNIMTAGCDFHSKIRKLDHASGSSTLRNVRSNANEWEGHG